MISDHLAETYWLFSWSLWIHGFKCVVICFSILALFFSWSLSCLIFAWWETLPFDSWVFWQDSGSFWLLPFSTLCLVWQEFLALFCIFPMSVLSPFSKKSNSGLFSGKLDFEFKIWMPVYVGLVIVSWHFNKIKFVGRGEKHTEIMYLWIYTYPKIIYEFV